MTMDSKVVKVVEGTKKQQELFCSGWRLLFCHEANMGGPLREEAKTAIENLSQYSSQRFEYKLKDGKMYGKKFGHSYYVTTGDFDDLDYALMTKCRPLCFNILRAKNLLKLNSFGSSDPYVVMRVVDRTSDYSRIVEADDMWKLQFVREEKQTAVKKRTLNPEWNEEIIIYVSERDEAILLDVFDYNWIRKDTFLGRAVIDLNDLGARAEQRILTPLVCQLKNIPGVSDIWFNKMSELFLGFYFLDIPWDVYTFDDEELDNDNNDTAANGTADSILDLNLNPLPDDWEERTDQNGRTFYVNHSTNSTQWERPIIGPITLESQTSQDGRFQVRRHISEEDDGQGDEGSSNVSPLGLTDDTLEESNLQNETIIEGILDSSPSAPLEDYTEVSEQNQEGVTRNISIFPSAPLEVSEQDQERDLTGPPPGSDMHREASGGRVGNRGGSGTYQPSTNRVHISDTPSSALPPGWRIKFDRFRRPIYINASTRTSQYERPTSQPAPPHPLLRNPYAASENQNNPSAPTLRSNQTDPSAPTLRSNQADQSDFHQEWEAMSAPFDEGNSEAFEDRGYSLEMNSSEISPYSWDYKAKYDTFIKHQVSYAAYKVKVSDKLVLKVHRDSVFLDSFEAIQKIPPIEVHMLRARLWVEFAGEDGLDYGGLAREWFCLLSQSMFNPYHGLFEYSAVDNYTLQINPQSKLCDDHHLEYFKFIGRVAGMAVFHRKLLDGFFIRPFYKMMLRKPITLDDMEAVDAEYTQSLKWIKDNDPEILCMTFSVDEQVFGKTIEKELIPGGSEIDVTEENKLEYIEKIIEWRFISRIKEQMDYFMAGFNDVIPLDAIQVFDEGELELLLSGIGSIDANDWKENTKYKGYSTNDIVIKWFWRVVFDFGNYMRSRLLQFVTGTSRIPMNGFKELYGSNGPQKFTIEKWGTEDKLPQAHTCFNRIDLPPYRTFSELKDKLEMAVEGSSGFGGVD